MNIRDTYEDAMMLGLLFLSCILMLGTTVFMGIHAIKAVLSW